MGKIIDQWTGAGLHPGDPEVCQGNGKHEGFECCCDECHYILDCFSPWMSVCAFQCKRCGDVLKREYKSPNDYGGGMMTCSCGHLTLDPMPRYYRVFGEDVENLCKIGGYELVEV